MSPCDLNTEDVKRDHRYRTFLVLTRKHTSNAA